MCDAAIGCCHPDQIRCGQALADYEALIAGEKKMSGGAIALILLLLALLATVVMLALYYRRKYRKEADPEPIVTYSSKPKENGISHEFENQLYDPHNQPPAYSRYREAEEQPELLEEDEDDIEARKLGTGPKANRTNEYASLDDLGLSSLPSSSNRAVGGSRGEERESSLPLLDGETESK